MTVRRPRRLLALALGALLGASSVLATPRSAQAAGALAIDQEQHLHWQQGNTLTMPAVTTATGNEAVFVFVAVDAMTVSSVTGGGLTFTKRVQDNTPVGGDGDVEVWTAYSAAALSGTVFQISFPCGCGRATATVVTFQGVSSTTPVGASAHTSHVAGTAPSVSLTTTQNNSWVYGVGSDVMTAAARTLGGSQTRVHDYTDVGYGTDRWVQRQTAVTPTSGTLVTINDSAPTADQWNLAAVEVFAAAPATPPTVDQTVISGPTSPTISMTAANELVLVYVSMDVSGNSIAQVSGGGLTYALAVKEDAVAGGGAGDAEVWWAYSTAQLSNLAVSVDSSKNADLQLDVVTLTGALPSGPIGATNHLYHASGTAPSVSLTTTQNDSWVFGVGAAVDNTTTRTLGAGQTMVDEFSDATAGTDFWVQRRTSSTPTAGTVVTINDTAPTNSEWSLAIVEILPAATTGASIAVTAGSLGFVSTPGNITFPTVTLNGSAQTPTQTLGIDVADLTGSGSGWNVQLSGTTFTTGSHTLAANATTVQAAPSQACDTAGQCVLATTSVGYPFTLSTSAQKLFNATANTGMGSDTVTPTFQLAIPGSAFVGTYTSTWTFSLVSGP